MIHCNPPGASYQAYKAEIDEAMRRVMNSGWYVLGGEVEAFEREFAQYIGTPHAIGVANGTDGLHLALRAYGIGANDEVITVSHTAVATVAAITLAGATPVFVDVEPETFTIDVEQVRQAITSRTRAIMPVHLYGQPASMRPLLDLARAHHLRIIEDASQAHGAKYHNRRVGSLGDVGVFSLYPTKNLGAIGDAGVVVTSDDQLASRLRELRQYGWDAQRISHMQGMNSRLDELQAAIVRVKLQHLDTDNARRRELAMKYTQLLAGLPLTLPATRERCEHVFHLYVIRTPRRDELMRELRQQGVGAQVHYPVPVHQQPALSGYASRPLPVTEQLAHEVLSLPLYPQLMNEQLETIAQAVRHFYGSHA